MYLRKKVFVNMKDDREDDKKDDNNENNVP